MILIYSINEESRTLMYFLVYVLYSLIRKIKINGGGNDTCFWDTSIGWDL